MPYTYRCESPGCPQAGKLFNLEQSFRHESRYHGGTSTCVEHAEIPERTRENTPTWRKLVAYSILLASLAGIGLGIALRSYPIGTFSLVVALLMLLRGVYGPTDENGFPKGTPRWF
jgi:hypothetical protein